jgi:uncharacterized RDD family membrane protein YckC
MPSRYLNRPADTTVYAGFWRRCAAYLIDTLFVCVVELMISIVIVEGLVLIGGRNAMGGTALYYALGLLVTWLYYALQESSAVQATLGKRVMDLKVVDESGQRIGFGRATFRFIAKILSLLTAYVGFMLAGWTERKQALHDFLAGTYVVFGAVEPGTDPPRVRPAMPWYGWVVNCVGLVAPFAIVGAIGLPAYNDYSVRAQAIEGFYAADAAKLAIGEFYIDNERCPLSADDAKFDASAQRPSRVVESVAIIPDCGIVVTFGDAGTISRPLRGQRIDLRGVPNSSGLLDWTCTSTMQARYVMPSCP